VIGTDKREMSKGSRLPVAMICSIISFAYSEPAERTTVRVRNFTGSKLSFSLGSCRHYLTGTINC